MLCIYTHTCTNMHKKCVTTVLNDLPKYVLQIYCKTNPSHLKYDEKCRNKKDLIKKKLMTLIHRSQDYIKYRMQLRIMHNENIRAQKIYRSIM